MLAAKTRPQRHDQKLVLYQHDAATVSLTVPWAACPHVAAMHAGPVHQKSLRHGSGLSGRGARLEGVVALHNRELHLALGREALRAAQQRQDGWQQRQEHAQHQLHRPGELGSSLLLQSKGNKTPDQAPTAEVAACSMPCVGHPNTLAVIACCM